jgi:hypothetical protein
MPNFAGQMKVQGINVMNLGNSVDVVMLKSHSEEQCLKDGVMK